MQHYRSLDEVSLQGAWVTIGSFDGVHHGHQSILSYLVQHAHASGQPAAVITFFPHPAIVLRGLQGPFYLTQPEEKVELLAEMGVDHIITLTFSRELAARSAEDFMTDLADHLHPSHLVVGHDFALGRGRTGNVHELIHLGRELSYKVEVIPASMVNSQLVSSTRIRDLVTQGKVHEAAAMLGRWYSLQGRVIHGDGRGKQIGIPTANLSVWNERIIPARGVYATLTWVHNRAVPSVTNIGLRPTFETNTVMARIETHLLDMEEDLYGMELKLEFVKFLRSEQRFPSARALLDQIILDIQNAREVLPYVP